MNLIDKDTLLEELEKRKNAALMRQRNLEAIGQETVSNEMIAFELDRIISFINTFEVKEVDIEEEMKSWRHNHFNGKRDKEAVGEYLERVSQLDLAKHFFELGLKTIKGELFNNILTKKIEI